MVPFAEILPFTTSDDDVAHLGALVHRVEGLGRARLTGRVEPDEDGLVLELEVTTSRVLALVVLVAPDEVSVVVAASLSDPEPGPGLRLLAEVEWPARDASELRHAMAAAAELIGAWAQAS